MRYAIISDIHANLEALISVLSHIQTQRIDSIVCLGDIVGYGPSPNECIELVYEKCEVILTGNHDFACIDEQEKNRFNRYARHAIDWTIEQLSEKSRQLLSDIKYSENIEQFLLVHSSPDEPSAWNYIVTLDHAIMNFVRFNDLACFLGHTHTPIVFYKREAGSYGIHRSEKLDFNDQYKYLINVGSVGQPRDSNNKASYGILDTNARTYRNVRVAYEIEITQKKMADAGLSAFLINRLALGR